FARCLAALLLALLTPPALAAPAPAPAPTLRAGAAVVDITPQEFPLNLPGGFSGNEATKAADPLHARALVLTDGTTTLALVVVDNLGLAPETIEEAKTLAAKATGLRADHMLIASTHTHSAPVSNGTQGPALAYRKLLIEGIAQAITKAHAALKPASLGVGVQPLPEEVFNRRWFLKPGKMQANPFGQMDTVKMNPGNSPDVLDRPAGPVDPDITVISVRDAKNKPLALFANYALHYVGGVPAGTVSADYFGEFARLMPNRLRAGSDFIAMMANGASGDINNIAFGMIRPPREPFEQIRIVAGKAADAAFFAAARAEYRNDAQLAMVEREVTLSYRKPSEQQIKHAKEVLAITDEAELAKLPRLADHYARRTLTAAERPGSVTVTIQAIRIGDFCIVGIPFETFVEIGLDLKKRSPFARTMVIGLANGRHGYLPTPEQHRLGGYETWLGTNYVQEDASVILSDQLVEMMKQIAPKK
ncbi:MAG: neutral/alkaline non-lysosomal ceramidase N-terminal domain-containing protein, partial [Phycisphaeraceae bacterium]